MGSGAATTDISDVTADWVLVRKYAASVPTLTSLGEETGNFYASGSQTWTSETIDAGANNTYQPNIFNANWELDGSDNLVPEFELLGSNTGAFTGEQTTYTVTNSDNLATQAFRYWQVKATLNTGVDLTDTPKVLDIRLRDWRPTIALSSNSQRVGIGTSTPTAKLEIRADTNFITFSNLSGIAVGQVTSNSSGGVTYGSTGSDFAEYFAKDPAETLEKGDLVCLSDLGKAVKCSSLNTQVLGVVSDNPAFVGNSDKQSNPDYVLVGLLGQVDVKVSSESGVMNTNGTLRFGDTTIGKVLGSCDSYCPAYINPFAYAVTATPLSSTKNDLQIDGNLIVTGKTNLADVSITGNLTVGILTINGLEGSISSLGKEIKLQGEKVLIDYSGNIKTTGEITAKKLNIEGDSIGTGFIPVGQTKAEVKTQAVTDKSQVFLTPRTKTSMPLAVTQKSPGVSFTVEAETTVAKDIKFSWWVIN
jgi:hypothetical protein